MSENQDFVLNLSCPDKTGLVHAVVGWLLGHDCNIVDSDQFGDRHSAQFFMRVHFSGKITLPQLKRSFVAVAEQHSMHWQIWSVSNKAKTVIMASKLDHCLIDLLYRTNNNELPIDPALIVSNHRDAYPIAAGADIDFLHLPIGEGNKSEQEARLLAEIRNRDIELVVLARYMQILSDDFCAQLPGQIINIHHSFLPSFKGAKPYHQAHDRGVKLIGATAHYVTAELDEGPIIEQGVARVDHRDGAQQLAAVGRDIERLVLAQAIRYHAERRIIINGHRTVVFR